MIQNYDTVKRLFRTTLVRFGAGVVCVVVVQRPIIL